MKLAFRDLADADRSYALSSLRESHKQSPETRGVPWAYYKATFGQMLSKLFDDKSTSLIGAYDEKNQLVGWCAVSYGKRVSTLHWIHVKYELDGERMRRKGVMTALLDAADLGPRFCYTLRGRRVRGGSLDETLVTWLHGRHVTATYVPLKEFLK